MAMAMRRAAIYARYSTENQNERSIGDQIALCEEYAARSGFAVVARFSDAARSGGSMLGRSGLLDLLAAAGRGEFSAVIVEALDRVSRDMEDLAGIHKRLRFAGIDLVAVHEGVASTVLVGLRGLVGQLFREDGAEKVRRGMTGIIREGRSAGGRAYGYRPVPGRPGELAIETDEAAVVLRIFTEYAGGTSPRDIAARLNRDGVVPPRGARWNASTINGNLTRGHGILLNPMYRGELVWNRVRMIRDPESGRRVSRPNPESEWMRADAPHLRIVPPDIIEAALARKMGKTPRIKPFPKRTQRLLTGLLRCGACGSGMSQTSPARGRSRIMCSAARESGICSARRKVSLDAVEKAVIDGLREQLSAPDAMAAYIEAFNAKRAGTAADAARDKARAERRLIEITASIDRIVAAIGSGVLDPEEARKQLEPIRKERGKVEADLARAAEDASVVTLHPAAIEAYRHDLEVLGDALGDAVRGNPKAVAAFRGLVEAVVVTAGDPYRPATVEVRGRLAALLGEPVPDDVALLGKKLVAGEGLEPPSLLNALKYSRF